MNKKTDEMKETTWPSTHIRFEKWQYERIHEDSVATGKSIPWLLKLKYFTGRMSRVLMTVDERKAVLTELYQCRDALNRIADNVDEGYLEGWHTGCSDVAKKLTAIESWMVAIYGNR